MPTKQSMETGKIDFLKEGKSLLDCSVSENFYGGTSDFIEFEKTLTENETVLLEAMCWFLPRHMGPYDWNRPFACEILKMVRKHKISDIDSAYRSATEATVKAMVEEVPDMSKGCGVDIDGENDTLICGIRQQPDDDEVWLCDFCLTKEEIREDLIRRGEELTKGL